MTLGTIPDAAYPEYRYDVIFNAYKWDPQVGDSNTVARHVVLMDRGAAGQLERWAERLAAETMLMEEALIGKPHLSKALGLPKRVLKAAAGLSGYERGNNVRLMRFDFHPTEEGWALSEVNSDVPGGIAEASVLPSIAGKWFGDFAPHGDTAGALLDAFRDKVAPGGTIALVHATSYADDRQVMQCLGDCFENAGYRAWYTAPDRLAWDKKRAVGADGIIRFFPLEWLANLPRNAAWEGYFDTATPSCNHPVALFAQSKRLPLIWDELGVDIPTWKSLLPETVDTRAYGSRGRSPSTCSMQGRSPALPAMEGERPRELQGEWILKPALGRVGEGIPIKGTMPEKEIRLVEKAAKRHPEDWVAQRLFRSRPLAAENGEQYHLCIGAFTVDGKSAGFYGRVSPTPRMDANAKDIPVLVRKGGAS
ncbi:MAG: glutathionylspermidine synthase family protein [Kiritimatiellaeota bacterium]|nr:glutathionylspermidine synthase family protein [Kiritimatiellota bacterium]